MADVELTIVLMSFEAADPEALHGVLARYVVLTRQEPGCRNVDLCVSVLRPSRYVVVEKWESPGAQRAHFDAPTMVEMAHACQGLLRRPPDVDLLDSASASDVR